MISLIQSILKNIVKVLLICIISWMMYHLLLGFFTGIYDSQKQVVPITTRTSTSKNIQENCTPRWKYAYSDNKDTKLIIATEQAITEWEEALGNSNLFTYYKFSFNKIGYGKLNEKELGGITETIHDEGETKLLKFKIIISDNLDKELLKPLVIHELGHAMGINKHLENPNTIMHERSSYEIKKLTNEDIEMALQSFNVCAFTF